MPDVIAHEEILLSKYNTGLKINGWPGAQGTKMFRRAPRFSSAFLFLAYSLSVKCYIFNVYDKIQIC